MLALGLSRARAARADGDELTAFTLVGLTANMISPISWTHHLVLVVPALIVLADAGDAAGSTAACRCAMPGSGRRRLRDRPSASAAGARADRAAAPLRRRRAVPALRRLADLAVRAPAPRGLALPGRALGALLENSLAWP